MALIRCGFCGEEFDGREGIRGCGACGDASGCRMVRCPRCGYHNPLVSPLVGKIVRKLTGKGGDP